MSADDEAPSRGHLPGGPLLPGVLLIGAAAQLAGVVAQSDPAHSPLAGLKLTAVRGANITASAKPGQTVLLETQVVGRMGPLISARATAWVGEVVVLQYEVTLAGTAAATP
jgi:3-hydroxyacyl-[acyl-carrier-protein] dehydratase